MKMNKFTLLTAISSLSMASIFGFPAREAKAAILTVYEDKADFLADTGVTGTSAFPVLGSSLASFTHENLTFTSVAPNTLNLSGTDWTTRLPGSNELAINGIEHLNVDIATSVDSFGFDFVEPEFDPFSAPFVDSTFEVTLFNAGTNIGSFEFNAPNDMAAFVGVSSDMLFDRVEIREIVGAGGNEFYGAFYAGLDSVPDPTSVPEPSSLLGLLAFSAFSARSLLKRKPQ